MLDFDGPICSVFSGLPASSVAAGLLDFLRRKAVQLSPAMMVEEDPLEVLRWTANHAPEHLSPIEDELCRAEEVAVQTAEPAPGAATFIREATQHGWSVGVVSNNSARSVLAFLELQGLTADVHAIVGRVHSRPDLMKPDPAPVLRALIMAGHSAVASVLVGDSVTDVLAANSAGVQAIGYANRPEKWVGLVDAGAIVVINKMDELAPALLAAAAGGSNGSEDAAAPGDGQVP
ncbi:MAG: HAD family hydrolase [Pseudonocardia sp.]|nr:HAD family hydrolase [Pseudonocardia sp.]